jgi:hypothetical protein
MGSTGASGGWVSGPVLLSVGIALARPGRGAGRGARCGRVSEDLGSSESPVDGVCASRSGPWGVVWRLRSELRLGQWPSGRRSFQYPEGVLMIRRVCPVGKRAGPPGRRWLGRGGRGAQPAGFHVGFQAPGAG